MSDYDHTISGLLRKRGEMMAELSDIRERLAIVTNDVESLDRILETLGYDGEVQLTPRAARIVLFYRNELRHFLLGELRKAGPHTSRELAARLMQMEGKDDRDRRMLNDIVKRIGKALRQARDHGLITSEKVRGEFVWRAAPTNSNIASEGVKRLASGKHPVGSLLA